MRENPTLECIPGFLGQWRVNLRAQFLEPQKKRMHDVSIGLVSSGPLPTHDQLQALVAGVAGLSLLVGHSASYQVVGTAPFFLDGTWREGFIINPLARPLFVTTPCLAV